MAMKKVSAKVVEPEVEEKAPEVVETVNDGASDAPSEPAPVVKAEPPKEEPAKAIPVSAKPEAGPDGKVACVGLKTCFVGGMVRYEGQKFRQFIEQAEKQAARGELEILG